MGAATEARGGEQNPADGARRLRVVSLSTVYPNAREPRQGLFVRSRLQQMAAGAELVVIAPVALIEYSRAGRTRPRTPTPARWRDGAVAVWHPRWVYPPMGGVWNAVALFACLIWPLLLLRRRFRFDVIDAHFGYPEGIAAALLSAVLGRPFAVTLRGNETMHSAHRWRGLAIRWALRRAERVIAVSEPLREFAIRSGVERDRAVTIPNGIDAAVFYPRERTEVRERFGMKGSVKAIVSAGYLIERKGHHRVARAVAGLRSYGCNAELWVVGGPGKEDDFAGEIHRQVAELGLGEVVHFVGEAEPNTVAEYMAGADVTCLASTREGWPNVVNEALACGCPVVAFDTGGVPEMLPSEEYGIVAPAGDQPALEEALRRALAKEWDRARIAARGGARRWSQVGAEAVEQLRLAAASRAVVTG